MSWYSLTLFPSIAFGLVGIVAVLRAKREDIPQIVCALMRVREYHRPSSPRGGGKPARARGAHGERDSPSEPDGSPSLETRPAGALGG